MEVERKVELEADLVRLDRRRSGSEREGELADSGSRASKEEMPYEEGWNPEGERLGSWWTSW